MVLFQKLCAVTFPYIQDNSPGFWLVYIKIILEPLDGMKSIMVQILLGGGSLSKLCPSLFKMATTTDYVTFGFPALF